MSDQTYDVVIAGYADIETAKTDFSRLVGMLRETKIKAPEGVILVDHGADDEVHVIDAADHHGRKGLVWGGGIGILAGLFAPPLLAAAVIGAAAGGLVGKFNKHRIVSGVEKEVGETIPKGTAGIIALVDTLDSDLVGVLNSDMVRAAVPGAAQINVVAVEGDGIKDLNEGLAEAAKGAKGGS